MSRVPDLCGVRLHHDHGYTICAEEHGHPSEHKGQCLRCNHTVVRHAWNDGEDWCGDGDPCDPELD